MKKSGGRAEKGWGWADFWDLVLGTWYLDLMLSVGEMDGDTIATKRLYRQTETEA